MMKKVPPGAPSRGSTCPVEPIYMMKKVAPDSCRTSSTWPVQPVYLLKNCSRDFTYRLYMACTAYIYDEKCFSRTFPTAGTLFEHPTYMMKNVPPDNSPGCSTWPVQPIYILKTVAPEISPSVSTYPVEAIYMKKKIAPETLYI
jgi:hypothetical protein